MKINYTRLNSTAGNLQYYVNLNLVHYYIVHENRIDIYFSNQETISVAVNQAAQLQDMTTGKTEAPE